MDSRILTKQGVPLNVNATPHRSPRITFATQFWGNNDNGLINMDTTPPPIPSPARTLRMQLAHASWVSILIAIAMNVAIQSANRGGVPAISRTITSVIAVLFAVTGITSGVIAIAGTGKYGRKGILVPAVIGISIWLLLFAIAVPSFLAARQRALRAAAMKPAVHSPTATRVEDASLGFAFDLPDDYQPFPTAKKPAKYSFAFFRELPNDVNRVLLVQPLGGVLPDRRLKADDLQKKAPTQLSSISWRGLEVDCVRVSEQISAGEYITYNVQIPLRKQAIQIGFGGPASADAELRALADQVLSTLEGETNW